MRLAVRVLAVVLIVGAVGALGVHYADSYAANSPYPVPDALATDYDAHVGETTLVFGTVESVDDAGATARIRVESDAGPFELTVTDFQGAVQPGGTVQVYGELRAERTIAARNVAVVNAAGSAKTYKYAVSVVGAILVLVLFFRQWRVDTDAVAFEVRVDE